MSKTKGKDLTIIFGVVLVFSAVFVVPLLLNNQSTIFNNKGIASTNNGTGILQSVTVTNLANITIVGNTNLTNTATLEGWTGTGGPTSPFIIANYDITSSGITILDTTLYFDLVNITISSFDPSTNAGLSFTNVTNANVKNVTASLSSTVIGFALTNSSFNTFVNCTANNDMNGFALTHSWNNTLSNSTFNADQSISVGLGTITGTSLGSDNNTIELTTIKNDPFAALAIQQSKYNYVVNNTFINNGFNSPLATNLSIALIQAVNTTFANNSIPYDFTDFAGSPNSTIINNLFGAGLFFQTATLSDSIQGPVSNNFLDNGQPIVFWQSTNGGTVPAGAGQIILMNTTNALITGQTMSSSLMEIQNLYSNVTEIANSQFSGNYVGVYSYGSNNVTIYNNNFRNSTAAVEIGMNATITNNICNNATIVTMGFSNATVQYNSVKNAPYGFGFESSYNLTVRNNNAFNDTDGFYLLNVTTSLFNSNSAINNTHSFNITDSSFNTFTNDTAISHGTNGFLLVSNSNNNTIYNCTSDYNSVGFQITNSSYNSFTNNSVYGNSFADYQDFNATGNTIIAPPTVVINPTTTVTQHTTTTQTQTQTNTGTVTKTEHSTTTETTTSTLISSVVSTVTHSTPGFLFIMVLTGLLAIVGYKRRRK